MFKIIGDWILKDEIFPDDEITLIQANKKSKAQIISFDKKGNMKYSDTRGVGCGLGAFSIKKAKCKLKDKKLYLDIQTENMGISKSHYKLIYEVSQEKEGELVLIKQNDVLIHKESLIGEKF